MSIGYSIAIRAVPFFDLLDEEEESLATQVLEAGGGPSESAAMDACRRRLAQGVDAFVRSLPTAVRTDVNTSRLAAYALAGLADERMLHHPAGGLDRWRERLLEFELYGSALAGQEIVSRARAATYGTLNTDFEEVGGAALLAPLYLGLFRSGFEGSLRGDSAGLASLIASLEETVGAAREAAPVLATGTRPMRFGLSTTALWTAGLSVWLIGGFGVWVALSSTPLVDAERIADRVAAAVPVLDDAEPLERSIGPAPLSPLESAQARDGDAQRDARYAVGPGDDRPG